MSNNRSSNETTFIYALIDPTTKQIRYVGKSDDPQGRLVAHLQERGIADKNQWLKGILSEGQTPEICILEEVPLHPPYLWQERERWWIAHLRKQGVQLTNVVYGGRTFLRRDASGFIPRRQSWKGYRGPHIACVELLLSHLAAGREERVRSDSPDRTLSPFPPTRQYVGSCTRLPTGMVIYVGNLPLSALEHYVTWFCRCTITVPHPLTLGIFPVPISANDRECKTRVYPTEPGVYESFIWKEQAQDCLDARCQVAVNWGFAWREWTRDNQAFLSLCQALWPYAPMPEEQDKPLSESSFLYHLAKHLMETTPYPKMLHWFSYAIMQSDRSWYFDTLQRRS